MTLSPALEKLIEEEMKVLTKEDFLRPGMAFDKHVGEYSNLLAQEKEDEPLLSQAGFDTSLMPKYHGYMDMLVLVHGDRVVAESDKKESRKEFNLKMPEAKKDKKLLMAVGRYIVKRTDSKEDKKVYDMVAKGYGDVDTLTDNVTMVALLRKHKGLAQEVRPGGKTVDESYLASVEEKALGLIKLRGEAITSDDDSKEQVDRQNRLITLTIIAQREIKLYAEMAFYDDTDRYDQFYASDERRQQGKGKQDEPAKEQEVPQQ